MGSETLDQAVERLVRAGFGEHLAMVGASLRSTGTGIERDPSELKAVEILSFGDGGDSGRETLLIAVATTDDVPVGTFTAPNEPSPSSDSAKILAHLHRLVLSPEQAAEHKAHDHVAAVFDDRGSAETAIRGLRKVGLGSDHLGVAIHHSDHVVFEHDEEQDMLSDIERGVGAGAALGFLGGMLLFAVAVPGVGTLAAGGIAALGAASGIAGAMLGGYTGVAVGSEEFDDHVRLRQTKLEPGEVLVVACGHGHQHLVESTLQGHGGRLVSVDD